jgi:hypothetical protein
VLGILIKRTSASGVKAGIISGIAANFILWVGFPGVSWLWWNAAGSLSAILVGYVWSYFSPAVKIVPASLAYTAESDTKWKWRYFFMIVYFFLIIIVSYIVERIWLG